MQLFLCRWVSPTLFVPEYYGTLESGLLHRVFRQMDRRLQTGSEGKGFSRPHPALQIAQAGGTANKIWTIKRILENSGSTPELAQLKTLLTQRDTVDEPQRNLVSNDVQ